MSGRGGRRSRLDLGLVVLTVVCVSGCGGAARSAAPHKALVFVVSPPPANLNVLQPLPPEGSVRTLLTATGLGARRFHVNGENGYAATFECVGGGTTTVVVDGASFPQKCNGYPSTITADDTKYSLVGSVRANRRQRWRILIQQRY